MIQSGERLILAVNPEVVNILVEIGVNYRFCDEKAGLRR